MPEWFDEYKKHKWELYINMFDIVELLDVIEWDDDYYYVLRWEDWEIFEASCVIALVGLKDKIDQVDYSRLQYWWQINVLDNIE